MTFPPPSAHEHGPFRCTCHPPGLGGISGALCPVHSLSGDIVPRCACRPAMGGVYGVDSCPVHGLPGPVIPWGQPRGHGNGCGCRDCAVYRAALAVMPALILQLSEQIVRSMSIPPPVYNGMYGSTPLPPPVTMQVFVRGEQPPEPERARHRPSLVLPVVAMLVALAVVSQLLYWFH